MKPLNLHSFLSFIGSSGLSEVTLPQSAQRPLRKSSKTHFVCGCPTKYQRTVLLLASRQAIKKPADDGRSCKETT
jgi:hypothetical protein